MVKTNDEHNRGYKLNYEIVKPDNYFNSHAFICIKLKSRDSLKILRNAYLARNVFQKQRHSE